MDINDFLFIVVFILVIWSCKCGADYFAGKQYPGWYGNAWKSGIYGTDWGGWGWGYPTSYINYNNCYTKNDMIFCPSVEKRNYDTPFIY